MRINFVSIFLFLSFSAALHSSCERELFCTDCGGNDPVNSLPWLQEMISEIEAQSTEGNLQSFTWIRRFCYQGKSLFVVGSCCPACSWAPLYYDCEGKATQFSDQEAIQEAWQRKGEVVWAGEACNF